MNSLCKASLDLVERDWKHDLRQTCKLAYMASREQRLVAYMVSTRFYGDREGYRFPGKILKCSHAMVGLTNPQDSMVLL